MTLLNIGTVSCAPALPELVHPPRQQCVGAGTFYCRYHRCLSRRVCATYAESDEALHHPARKVSCTRSLRSGSQWLNTSARWSPGVM